MGRLILHGKLAKNRPILGRISIKKRGFFDHISYLLARFIAFGEKPTKREQDEIYLKLLR